MSVVILARGLGYGVAVRRYVLVGLGGGLAVMA